MTFFLIVFILFLGYFFSKALSAREFALEVVRRHCQKLELQWLDECVALTSFWAKRDSYGKLHAWRAYSFEFSVTGTERYKGRLVMLGTMVTAIELEPYKDL
ncbi:MAG: DUF3301 domain-containing protein [Methylococcales bacterium]|nr:DUF3301 domain-containing protein [Methylococcales bacterium]